MEISPKEVLTEVCYILVLNTRHTSFITAEKLENSVL